VSDTSVSGSLVVSFRVMKKLPFYAFLAILGAFSVPYIVSATTVYQQLSDSAGEKTATAETIEVGSFVSPPVRTTLYSASQNVGGKFGAFILNKHDTVSGSGTFSIASTSADCPATTFFVATNAQTVAANEEILVDLEFTSGTDKYLMPSTTYFICFTAAGASIEFGIAMNLSADFIYGYITDVSGVSVPLTPNIPGFTDVGISTTSQQVWCNQNFSTSTGFLDSVGQSIALGLCNVTVFLFVPSSNAFSQFQTLSSTTQSKVPFSYVFDAYDIFLGLTASSTGNIAAMSLSFPDISSSTPFGSFIPTSVVGLSTSTISTYLPESVRLGMLGLQRVALWSGLAFMFYRRIIPHKATV